MLLQELDWTMVEKSRRVTHQNSQHAPQASTLLIWIRSLQSSTQTEQADSTFLSLPVYCPFDLTRPSQFECNANPSNVSCINFTFLPTSLNTFFLPLRSMAEEEKTGIAQQTSRTGNVLESQQWTPYSFTPSCRDYNHKDNTAASDCIHLHVNVQFISKGSIVYEKCKSQCLKSLLDLRLDHDEVMQCANGKYLLPNTVYVSIISCQVP